jgi:hypothetical protein
MKGTNLIQKIIDFGGGGIAGGEKQSLEQYHTVQYT